MAADELPRWSGVVEARPGKIEVELRCYLLFGTECGMSLNILEPQNASQLYAGGLRAKSKF